MPTDDFLIWGPQIERPERPAYKAPDENAWCTFTDLIGPGENPSGPIADEDAPADASEFVVGLVERLATHGIETDAFITLDSPYPAEEPPAG